jgi:hypothetical protein
MLLSFRIALIASFFIAAFVSVASGQDRGQVGLVVGYPATVGVLWQVSDRLGIRGEASFTWSSSSIDEPATPASSSTFTTPDGVTVTIGGGSGIGVHQETHGVSGSIGVSALVTLTKADQLRTYIAPRLAWAMSRSTTTIEYDLSRFVPPSFLPPPGFRGFQNQEITTKSTTPSYGASFGATTMLRGRFGVFGELGFAYTSTGSLPLSIGGSLESDTTREVRTVSLRSGIGVSIFF